MNEEYRKTPPTPLPAVAFNVPQPFETVLPNGLKIVLFEDQRLPLVSFRLIFRTGEIFEPNDSIGLTSATASLLSEGTENYSSRQFAEHIERLGASLSASSNSDNTIVSASALSLYVSDMLGLLRELVLTPTFPENELDLYKRNTIEGLKFQRSQANFLADEQISKMIYGMHPYSIVSPKAEDVEKITREGLFNCHRQIFLPNNAVFIAVGDLEREEFLREVADKFEDWEEGKILQRDFPSFPFQTERKLKIVDRKGSAQSNIVLANPAVNRNHPDYFPLLVMNQILGAGASSRIFMNLREEKGYTYGAYSKLDLRKLGGAFEATAEVRTAVTGDSLREFFIEFDRIRDEKVSQQELEDAQNFLAGVFPIRAETQEGLTSFIVQQQIYDLPDDYLQTYREKINAVSIDDVEIMAGKYVLPEKMAIVIVGDAEEILPQAKDYAENLEIFDTEGNLQESSNYGKPAETPTVDLSGNWKLTIDFQGQEFPVSLILSQDGAKVSGTLGSMLGEGIIENGKISANNFTALATTEMQGQPLELSIAGTVENELMTGTLSAPIMPVPLPFKGTRGE